MNALKTLASHFQPTLKSLKLAALAILAYLAQEGKLTDPAHLTWADVRVAAAAYVLAILIPKRIPAPETKP